MAKKAKQTTPSQAEIAMWKQAYDEKEQASIKEVKQHHREKWIARAPMKRGLVFMLMENASNLLQDENDEVAAKRVTNLAIELIQSENHRVGFQLDLLDRMDKILDGLYLPVTYSFHNIPDLDGLLNDMIRTNTDLMLAWAEKNKHA